MDNYRCYLPARAWIFKSFGQDLTEQVLYSLGASSGLSNGDSGGYTSYDRDSDDDVTFSFHTCLDYGFDLGGVSPSFTGALGSSFSSHSFLGD